MANPLCHPKTVENLKRQFGFSFTKSLGQNFLIEEEVPYQIALQSGITKEEGVLEIGPGFGTLTYELCQRAKKVVAIELDKTLLPVLEQTLSPFDNVEVVQGDFLKLDIPKLLEEKFFSCRIPTVRLCANLPYYITTPIIMAILEQKMPFASATLMVQKEVAQRLCADEPCGDTGAITLAVQYRADAKILFDVPNTAFMPAPKVTSSVISLVPLEKARVEVVNEKNMFSLIKAAFALRRKTLCNALSMQAGIGREQTLNALNEMGLPPDIRGEKCTLEQYATLSNLLQKGE